MRLSNICIKFPSLQKLTKSVHQDIFLHRTIYVSPLSYAILGDLAPLLPIFSQVLLIILYQRSIFIKNLLSYSSNHFPLKTQTYSLISKGWQRWPLNWVRLTYNGTYPSLLKIIFQYILPLRAKKTQKIIRYSQNVL